jgi:hypothetical protein
MEVESFENEEVADVMNNLFVNIKVDREERPDIDRVYMSYPFPFFLYFISLWLKFLWDFAILPT